METVLLAGHVGTHFLKTGQGTSEAQISLVEQGRKTLVPLCVCKQYDCSCHCMRVDTDAFRHAHRRQEEENRHRLSRWVRVLLCISRWPLKVALCHNTLVPTTPAAVKCHRPLLSASQPARFSRQPSLPHFQGKALPH